MISLMLSSFLLLPASIMANSTTSTSRQTPFFNRLRKRNRVPSKTNQFDPFLQARALTPKEHGFDMPSFLKYGSTGRPPGKFHIRHSLKDFTYNLEFSHPPFDIFFIEIANNNNNNNNNNNISYIDNGGNAVPAGNGNYSDSDAPDDAGLPVGLPEWFTFTDQIESINCSYKFNKYKLNKYKLNIDGLNIDGISSTTTATPATATINYKTRAEGISTEDGEDAEAPGLSERLADRLESNRCKYKYKFNIDGISTTTTTAATPAPTTINYKTSTEGIPNEVHRSNQFNSGKDRIESNRCNYKYKYKFNTDCISTTTTTTTTTSTTTSTNNDDETPHLSFIITLLCLIIIKSFSPKEFKTAPKEKQQQHYHGKQRHQFHLEQQQKHQYFKQQHHNVERMTASIVLKLTLVAWDMWTYRNGF